jgi:hypothetical protein
MTYRPDESEHRHNQRVRCVRQRRAEATLTDFDDDIERVSDVNNAISGTYHGKSRPCKTTSPTSTPNSASACNSFKKQLATRDHFYGSANHIQTHCSVFFTNYLAEARNYPPTRLRRDTPPLNRGRGTSSGGDAMAISANSTRRGLAKRMDCKWVEPEQQEDPPGSQRCPGFGTWSRHHCGRRCVLPPKRRLVRAGETQNAYAITPAAQAFRCGAAAASQAAWWTSNLLFRDEFRKPTALSVTKSALCERILLTYLVVG